MDSTDEPLAKLALLGNLTAGCSKMKGGVHFWDDVVSEKTSKRPLNECYPTQPDQTR
jgi:hypothetical protein